MIPIRDHNPSGRVPLVTYALIGLNVLVFVLMISAGETGFERYIFEYALIPADIVRGENLSTLITAMFLHGGWAHLLGNMLFLRIFGDNLEDRMGHLKFLLFYLLAGIAGSALQIAFGPDSTIPNVGASGAIAGVMGGYLLLFPRERVDVWWGIWGVSTVPAALMLGYWIFYQFILGTGTIGTGDQGGVAYWAHIGGFAFGFLTVRLIARPTQPRVRQIFP